MPFSIEMTLGGVLRAGKWKTEDELKTYSDFDCYNTIVSQLKVHSKQDEAYYGHFSGDELIGKGAIVVFLSQVAGYGRDTLKTMSDGDHRNTIIAENNKRTGIAIGLLQGMTNQDLVLLGLNTALIIINVTPLQLKFMDRDLKPFVPRAWPFPQAGFTQAVTIFDAYTQAGRSLSFGSQSQEGRWTRVIDTAFLRAVLPGRTDAYGTLQVTNDTPGIVNAYLLGVTDEARIGQIRPGEVWRTPVNFSQLWQFRSAFSDEIIGMFVTPGGGFGGSLQLDLRLTDEFRRASRAYRSPNADPGTVAFSPLRLIGERRTTTPAMDDQTFLTVTVVREEFTNEVFNCVPNRTLRDLEISGPLLRWSGNRILANYHGVGSADTRSLRIYADRMEVANRLHFPRANVTIYARELVFTGPGCIDTTPLDHTKETRAQSKYLTVDPEDPTNASMPADEDGNATYAARDGATGEKGGSVTLHVAQLINDDPNKKRFVCRGGKGQQGEAGGLKKYVAGDYGGQRVYVFANGQRFTDSLPERYGPLNPVKEEDLNAPLRHGVWGISSDLGPSNFRWPGGDSPSQMKEGSPPAGELLRTGKVVKVDLYVWSDLVADRYLVRGFLPNGEHLRWARPLLSSFEPSNYETYNPAPVPCYGRNAYAGGWPGDGGDGGAVTTVLASAPVVDGLCDLGPGQAGNYTEYVAGGAAPGPTPAYALRIDIVRKTPPWESDRQPEVRVQEIGGRPGAHAAGRHFEGTAAPTAPVAYQTKRGAAKAGGNNNDGKPINKNETGLSWAHPAALSAVIAYARTAFRNGFREEAAAALDPYYALAAGAGAADVNLRLALAQVVTMRNNLVQNLDYYGNPPGWVPRLNALSNLENLKTVRDAAYGTYYFADKMVRDFNKLENQREVSQGTSDALAEEVEVVGRLLDKAYKALPGALRALDAVQQEMVPVEKAIVDLRKRAEAKGIEKVKVQRIVSGALQLAGGVAQSLPVGQPFSGLGGSGLSALGEFDWNAEEPLASAKGSLASLSGHVNAFVTDKNTKAVEALTSGVVESGVKKDALVKKLTRQLEDEEKEPEEKEKAPKVTTWKNFKTAERTRLDQRIKEVKDEIEELKKAATDDAKADVIAGNSFLAELQLQKAALDAKREGRSGDAQQLSDLRWELLTYQKKQSEVEAEARRLAKVKNAKLKKAAKEAAKDEERISALKQELTATQRRTEDHGNLVAARKKTAEDVMSSLDMLGTGLSTMGNAVIKMVTPITADDPTVKRLADQILTEDPELREKGKALNLMLMGIVERKKKAAAELFRWQNEVSKAATTISNNLAAMTELSRQRQSLDQGLDPSVLGYLKECRERAKEALAESIYWFVKSYQYECLSDVEDSFYNFDSWTTKLTELEKTKQGATLSKEDFEKIGNQVFKDECAKLGQELLKRRQKHGEKKTNPYPCVLERHAAPKNDRERRHNELLDSLEKGEATFNFIRDFQQGSEAWNDARVFDVVLTDFAVKTDEENLALTIRIEQTGDLIIANKEPEGRVFYVFRPGRNDDPIYWQLRYAHSKRKTNNGVEPAKTEGEISDNLKALFGAGTLAVKEYNASLLSDFKIRLTDLYVYGLRKNLKAISRVEMTVTIGSGY